MNKLKELLNDILSICEFNWWINFYNHIEEYNYESKIKEYNNKIYEIYNKYNVNNIDELVLLVKDYTDLNQIIKDNELVKLLIYILYYSNEKDAIKFNNESFKYIYKYIIDNNLYDPNWSIGASSEPMFCMLPLSNDLYDTNIKVFNNGTIDWYILKNGTDAFVSFVWNYLSSKSHEEQTYYYKIIKIAIEEIDFDNNTRYMSSKKCVIYDNRKSILKQLESYKEYDLINPILEMINNKSYKRIK